VNARGTHIEINPKWLDPERHVGLLNQAFPGQWNHADYDWYITRPFRGMENDTFVTADGQRLLSTMTMCYRQVGTDSSCPVDVGVLSAGATLRSERGRGHYGRMLDAAREHALEKGYAALLGFVTRDNTSGRGLAQRGARALPSFYVFSVHGRGPRNRPPRHGAAPAAPERAAADITAFAQRESSGLRGARFLYERAHDWRRQFTHRPNPVHVLRPTHDSLALIETVRGTDRLQWLAAPRAKVTAIIAGLAGASATAGRQFFLYTLDPLLAAAARRLGLGIRPGYLMLWPTGHAANAWRAIADTSWNVQSGDRL